MYVTRRKVQRVSLFTLSLLVIQILSPFVSVIPVYAQAASETSSSASSSSQSSTSSEESSTSSQESVSSSSTTSADNEESSSSSSTESSTSESSYTSSESSTSSAPSEDVEEVVEEVEVEEEPETVVYADGFVPSGLKAFTTNGVVQTGVKYVFPMDNGVTIEFTKLPEISAPVTITQVTLSSSLVSKLNAVSNIAYDFTTDMEDGSFEYVITLPNKAGNAAKVVYAETVAELSNAKELSNVEVSANNQVAFEADHFTVFVVTSFEEEQTTLPSAGYNDIWFTDSASTLVTRVASGTNGITSSEGDNHAQITGYAFTRWDGYKNEFPFGGFTTSVDVYLDMSLATGGVDKRFDFSSAISTPTGDHRRDFIFHLGTNPAVAGQWLANASNNAPGNPGGANSVNITSTGWYTLEHQFKNVGGVLQVTLNLYQKGNPTPVGTWVRSNATDIIGTTVGGNRYGWFTPYRFDFDWLAIDNAQISYDEVTTVEVRPSALNGWSINSAINDTLGAPESGSDVNFIAQPDSPLPGGALELITNSSNDSRIRVYRTVEVPLFEISRISFDAKKVAGPSVAGVSFRLGLDNDGNGTIDQSVVYEPYYNGSVLDNTWQTWDVKSGKFWGAWNPAGGYDTNRTITDIPGTSASTIVRSISIGLGNWNPDWNIVVDNLRFNNTVYNFENQPNQAPVVTIIDPTPAENSYVRGTITGHATATDDNGMGSWYLRFWKDAFEIAGGGTLVGNCQAAPGGDLLGTFIDVTCDYDTTLNPDGLYVFSAQVQDSDIIWGQALRQLYVDNTRPEVTLVNPAASTTVFSSDAVDFQIDATDNFALNQIVGNIYKDGSLFRSTSVTVAGSPANGSQTIDLATVMPGGDPLPEGSYTLRYNASDLAGNISQTKTFDFTIDNTAPAAPTIVFPAEDTYFKTAPILNDWTDVTDPSGIDYYRIEYQYDDGHAFSAGPYRTTTASQRNHTPALSEQGGIKFRVQAFDKAGNEGAWSEWRHYYYDATAPSVPVNGQPHNTTINTNNFYFTWDNSADNLGPVHYEFKSSKNPSQTGGVLDTAVWNNTDSSHPEQNPLNNPTILSYGASDGTWYWQVRAIDAAGNASAWSEIWNVTIDTTAPITTLVSPANNAIVNGASLVQVWNSADSDVDYFIYESYHDAAATSLRWHEEFTTSSKTATNVADTTFWWRVRAVDLAGNVGPWSELWKLTVDNTAPSTVLTAPLDNQSFNNPIAVTGTSTDTNGVDFVTLQYRVAGSGDTWTNISVIDNADNNSPFGFSYDWTPSAEGTYDIRAFATDVAGNVESVTAYANNVTYDTTAPVLVMADVTITEGDTTPDVLSLVTNNPETLTVSCTPSVFGTAEVIVDQPNSSKVTPVTCEITDAAGNITTATANFIVENNVPTVSLTPASDTIVTGEILGLTASAAGGNADLNYAWACTGGTIFTTNSATRDFYSNSTGTFTCTVTVTDADGDVVTASSVITVNAAPVTPINGGNNGGGNIPNGIGDAGNIAGETTAEEVDEELEEEGEVLGAGNLICEQEFKLAGKVFIDLNSNNVQDADEPGAQNVRIELSYRNLDGNFVLVEVVTTNADGEWETEGCPATYRIRLLTDSLPSDTSIVGDNEQLVTMGMNSVAGLTFVLASAPAAFNWLPLIVIFLILAAILGTIYYNRQRNA